MKWTVRVLAGLAVLYGLALAGVYVFQEHLLFRTDTAVWSDDYDFPAGHEFFALNRPDGAALSGVMLPPTGDVPPRGILVYFKGQTRNIGDLPRLTVPLRALGWRIFGIDYRGYGRSVGDFSEAAMLEDAEAFFDMVRARYPDEDMRVVGYSMGSTFASHVAQTRDVTHLMLFAPMSSILDMAKWRYPFLPSGLLRYPLRSDLKLAEAKTKLVIYHGTADRVVPHFMGVRLFEAADDGDDVLITLARRDHGNIINDPEVVADIAKRWAE